MGVFDTFATNAKAAADGKWFHYPKNKDGTIPSVKLARMGRTNPKFQAALERIQRTFKTEIKLDVLGEEMAFEPMLALFLETVLLEWEHIQDKEGKEIGFEKAGDVCRALPDFYDDMREKAAGLTGFREEEVAKTLPNS